MTPYSPWRAVAEMGDVIVAFVDVPSGRGWWEPDERVILIDRSLDRAQRRATLAHELEHVLAGDCGCDGTAADDYFTDKMERRANIRAARKLVTVEDLARALQLHEGDDSAVVEMLGVTQAVLDVRRETLLPDERHYLRRRLEQTEESA